MQHTAVLDSDLDGRIDPDHWVPTQGDQAGEEANASELVARASMGDQLAWDQLVDRYSRLVWTVARAHRLNLDDAADASHLTWLLLAQHLGSLPQPERLGEWLAATTKRESQRILALRGLDVVADQPHLEPRRRQATAAAGLLAAEREAEPWHVVSSLPRRCQPLLRLLMVEPPLSDAETAAALGMPIDDVGPARTWCLDCLRPGTTAGRPNPPAQDGEARRRLPGGGPGLERLGPAGRRGAGPGHGGRQPGLGAPGSSGTAPNPVEPDQPAGWPAIGPVSDRKGMARQHQAGMQKRKGP